MNTAEEYSYRLQFNRETNTYTVSCVESPDLNAEHEDPQEAISKVRQRVNLRLKGGSLSVVPYSTLI